MFNYNGHYVMTNFDFFKSISLLGSSALPSHALYWNSFKVLPFDDSKSGHFFIEVQCKCQLFLSFTVIGTFDNRHIVIRKIQYTRLQDMRFRPDELERCVPFFMGKYKNVPSFIRGFRLALISINNEFNSGTGNCLPWEDELS